MRKPLLYSTIWLFLLGLPVTAVTVSCSKAKEEPQPTTGTIEGTVNPVGSVTTVTAVNGGVSVLATPNATTGAFSVPNLAPGTYTLSFAPASGYGTPAPRPATVVAGQTTAAGTVNVPGNGTPRGTVGWTYNGASYNAAALSGSIDASGFRLEASAPSGAATGRVSLEVRSGISAVGAYGLQVSGPTGSNASYQHTTGTTTVSYNTALVQTSSTTGVSGTGTLVVSSFDAANRSMSGTFTYRAFNYDNGWSNIVWADITNGTFNIRY